MRILICDDDVLITDELTRYINEFFSEYKYAGPEIGIFHSGEDILNDTGEKDIVFLDIQMKGIDGIFVGNTLTDMYKNIIIIVITSYMEYLDSAMRFHVFRYLSKPIDKHRLFVNMADAMNLYNSCSAKIAIETPRKMYTVSTADIIMVTTGNRHVTVYTTNATYDSIRDFNYWVDTLNNSQFFRTHRSYIINMDYVSDYDHETISLCNNKYNAYLTKRKYNSFNEAYLLFLESRR